MSLTAQKAREVRDGARSSMFLAAELRHGVEQAPVKIRNMSALGALVESPIAPQPNSRVQLIRGNYLVEGRIVWSEPRRCGIRFMSQISVNDWLAPIAAQGPCPAPHTSPDPVDVPVAYPPGKNLLEVLRREVEWLCAFADHLAGVRSDGGPVANREAIERYVQTLSSIRRDLARAHATPASR